MHARDRTIAVHQLVAQYRETRKLGTRRDKRDLGGGSVGSDTNLYVPRGGIHTRRVGGRHPMFVQLLQQRSGNPGTDAMMHRAFRYGNKFTRMSAEMTKCSSACIRTKQKMHLVPRCPRVRHANHRLNRQMPRGQMMLQRLAQQPLLPTQLVGI